MEGCIRRRRPVTAWADDIKMWTGGRLLIASNKANETQGWRAMMRATAVPEGTI